MKMKNQKKHPRLKRVMLVLAVILVFCLVAGGIGFSRSMAKRSVGYDPAMDERIAEDTEGSLGRVRISTLPLEKGTQLARCSYSFSGRVIVVTRVGKDIVISSMNDDGTNALEIYRGNGSGTSRLLPFRDNRRILLGDHVLEVPEGYTLDNCPVGSGQLIPIVFPEKFSSDAAVIQKWTEVIIAPDCEHFAWTIRRKDCGAVNAMGKLVRQVKTYIIEDAGYISSMNGFSVDPSNPTVLHQEPVIGGEVKQFVRGGAAISLVGSAPNGMADSVLQDVATGEVTLLSCAPGYDETTLLSPDEKLGGVMTSRFSATTDMGALGLMHRPLGQPLHNILAQIYMYCVTGVRSGREGNVGPALVELSLAQTDPAYRGVYLGDPKEEYIFRSPLSWNDTGTKLMWIEGKKSGGVRVRIAELLDYKPGEVVATVNTPPVGSYATEPAKSFDFSGTLQAPVSGHAEITRKTGMFNKITVQIAYHDYSDDGVRFLNGTEESSGSIMSSSSYRADLHMTDAEGKELGYLEANIGFTAAYSISHLFSGNFSPDLKKESTAFSQYQGISLNLSELVP